MDESIQKQLEARTVNPWVAEHPKEALALRDLAAYVRSIPEKAWDFRKPWYVADCGSACCAMGHAANVPSCAAFMDSDSQLPTLDENTLDLPIKVADAFFYGHGFHANRITAPMVADRIDHWLATGEIR
jgi:hypothetical protein